MLLNASAQLTGLSVSWAPGSSFMHISLTNMTGSQKQPFFCFHLGVGGETEVGLQLVAILL